MVDIRLECSCRFLDERQTESLTKSVKVVRVTVLARMVVTLGAFVQCQGSRRTSLTTFQLSI
jgi:hypothetical protein